MIHMISLQAVTKRGKGILCSLILFCLFNVPIASAVERQPGQETAFSRLADAKSRLIHDIFSSTVKSDLVWFHPAGLVIILTQSVDSPAILQSVAFQNAGTEGSVYKSKDYTVEEAAALRRGGAVRVLTIADPAEDLFIKAVVTVLGSNRRSQQIETTISVGHDDLPVVAELKIIQDQEKPKIQAEMLQNPNLTHLKGLLTQQLDYLVETGADLEAAVLILAVLDQATEESDLEKRARLLLARIYLEWGMDSKADQLLQKMTEQIDSESDTATVWFYIGKLRYRQGRYQEAAEAFLKARDGISAPLLSEVLYLAGNSLLYQGLNQEAVELLAQVPKESQLYPFALYSMGLAYIHAKDMFSTLKQFARLMESDSKNEDFLKALVHRAHMTLGFFLVDQGRYREALEVFYDIPLDSLYADQVQFGVSWAYFQKDECEKAVVLFNKLISEWPDSTYSQEAMLNVGRCYFSLQAYRQAVENFQEALRFYAQEYDKLNALQDGLGKISLDHWLKMRHQNRLPDGRKSVFMRDLLEKQSIQKAMTALESLEVLLTQINYIEKETGEASLLNPSKQRLQQLQQEFEAEVKKVILGYIGNLQDSIEKRAVQADTGLLRSFNLAD